MGEIFANDISDKGSSSKIYQDFLQLNSNKTSHLIKKRERDLNRHFSKKDMQMANKYRKRLSMSILIKEMQIKSTMR